MWRKCRFLLFSVAGFLTFALLMGIFSSSDDSDLLNQSGKDILQVLNRNGAGRAGKIARRPAVGESYQYGSRSYSKVEDPGGICKLDVTTKASIGQETTINMEETQQYATRDGAQVTQMITAADKIEGTLDTANISKGDQTDLDLQQHEQGYKLRSNHSKDALPHSSHTDNLDRASRIARTKLSTKIRQFTIRRDSVSYSFLKGGICRPGQLLYEPYKFTSRELKFWQKTLQLPDITFNKPTKNPCWVTELGKTRCLPYFYQIGFTKCGTSDLYTSITSHPRILFARGKKEPMFWGREQVGRRPYGEVRITPFEKYVEFFQHIVKSHSEDPSADKIVGDGTPATVWDQPRWPVYPGNQGVLEPRVISAHHIKQIQPNAKILVIVRNPVDRLYSDYTRLIGLGYIVIEHGGNPEHFHELVVREIQLMQDCIAARGLRACVYDPCLALNSPLHLRTSMYCPFIKDWIDVFTRDQVHVVQAERYYSHRGEIVQGIYRFLNLSSPSVSTIEEQLTTGVKNKGSSRLPMLSETRRLLTEFFRPLNKMLSDLLQDELFLWEPSAS